MYWIVIARADRIPDSKGPFELATRRVFETRDEAQEHAEHYSPSREPMVVSGRFDELRFEGD